MATEKKMVSEKKKKRSTPNKDEKVTIISKENSEKIRSKKHKKESAPLMSAVNKRKTEENLEEKKKKKKKLAPTIEIASETPEICVGDLLDMGKNPFRYLSDVKNDLKFTQIAAGTAHCIGVANGKVWSWGSNKDGALGRFKTTELGNKPEIVEFLGNDQDQSIKTITAGNHHSAALLGNGHVYVWGTFKDKHGNTSSHKNGKKIFLPTRIKKKVESIASSDNHLLMLTKTKMYSLGCDENSTYGRICHTVCL